MPRNTALIVGGKGQVGRYAVDFLARSGLVSEIFVIDMKEPVDVAMNAVMGALINGYPVEVKPIKQDIMNVEETAKLLKELKPTIIFNAATMLSTFLYAPIAKRLVKELSLPLKSYLAGHTLAKDLAPIYKLMQAVKESGIDTKVVNIAFPDNSHIVLNKVGLSPLIGGGTIDLTVNAIRRIVAKKKNVPVSAVQVSMVAHHAIRVYPGGEVPYFIKIVVNGEDVTSEFNTDELINESNKMTLGFNNASMVAASAVENMISILGDKKAFRHSPGPNGLPGGYPLEMNADGVEVILPKEITLDKAIELNLTGMQKDGIERVDPDGTVTYTKECVMFFEEALGIHGWERMKLEETVDLAKELIRVYTELAKKYGYL